MAREHQGLQVLLIIFVMISVVLGVSLYLYVKRADEATKLAAASDGRVRDTEAKVADRDKEIVSLKTLIGYPQKSTQDIQARFDEVMKVYGSAPKAVPGAEAKADNSKLFATEELFYDQLVAGMYKTIEDRTNELVKVRGQVANLKTDFAGREKATAAQVAKLTEGFTSYTGRVKDIEQKYQGEMEGFHGEQTKIIETVKRVKTEANQTVAASKDEIKAAKTEAAAADQARLKAEEKVRKESLQTMDVPTGEITWVSLPNKTVWINRGRADFLQRGTRFTVYSGESTNAASAVKKGSVEVTRITGEHEAECRIVDDKLADPMASGDKVFTPLWSPGQKRHYVLVGIMNLDGDGRNQVSYVRSLIEESGGAVDCWLDEQGRRQGQVTSETQYCVLGDSPDKSSPDFIKNHGDILRDVERYPIQKMSLSDFKVRVNYQKSSSVEHFGRVGSTSDVNRAAAAKAAAGKAASKAKAEEK